MQCPKCEFENPQGANFCNNCGCSLQSNVKLPDNGSRAESHCVQQSKQKPLSHITSIVSERKQVTVLFSDLAGYTAMSEKLDPEEVKEITTMLFDGIVKIITKNNGFVEKFIGDAAMAVFGATKTREDDPVQAIKAALEIHELVTSSGNDFKRKIGQSLAMHSGINTGLVVTGDVNLEKGIHGLVGDTINLAARLSSLGTANEILVGPSTFLQTRNHFNFKAVEPTKIKGKAKPVSVYQVLSIKKQPMAAKGIEGVETKTVGRDAELQSLQSTCQKTIVEKKPHIVTVIGDAGIGKSRLLYEFKKWLGALSDNILVIEGRGTPDNWNSRNGLWKSLFSLQFDIAVDDSSDVMILKFRQNLANILTQDQADLVGHFVGFDFSTSRAVRNLLGSQSFEAIAFAHLAKYLRSIAESQTVILLDDIHFADDGSIEILERIANSIDNVPLMIVSMSRPSLYEQHPQWGDGIYGHQVIDLKPLSKQDSMMFVQDILKKAPRVPDKLGTLLIEAAEGNPFYIEELVKMLIEDDVIITDDEHWHIALDKLTDVKIPASLTGVLQARLDSLPNRQKRLLQRASVIGRLFWDQGVTQLIADDSDRLSRYELQTLLENGIQRELIFERERSTISESREFVFKHALLRDVAYETLLIKHRRIYHYQAAIWFTATTGRRVDEYLHLVAHHYELAGENHKAVEYFLKAGEMFFKKNAYQEAVSSMERALNLLPQEALKERAELLVKLGQVNSDKGEYSHARTHFTHALDYEQLLSPGRLVTTLYGLGWICSKMGEYVRALDYTKHGLNVARMYDDASGTAQCLHTKGWIYYLMGQFGDAVEHAQKALRISQEIGDKRSISLSLNVIQAAADGMGNYDEAMKINTQCIGIGREIGDLLVISRGLCNQGEHLRKQHKFQEAVRCYQESLEISREIGQKNLICITLQNLGFSLNQLQSFDDAQRCFCESITLALDIGSSALALPSVVGMAEIYAYNNQHVDSARLIGMVCAHPMSTHENEYETNRVLALLRKDMSESELQYALNRGKNLDEGGVFNTIIHQTT